MAISKEDNQDISRKLGKPVAKAVKSAALDNAKKEHYPKTNIGLEAMERAYESRGKSVPFRFYKGTNGLRFNESPAKTPKPKKELSKLEIRDQEYRKSRGLRDIDIKRGQVS